MYVLKMVYKTLLNLLQVPHKVQTMMCGEKTPILSNAVPGFELFMTSWESLGDRFQVVKQYTDVGLQWARKYYSKMDNTRAYVVGMSK